MAWRILTAVTRSRRPTRQPLFEALEPRCLLAAITMLDDEQLVIEMVNRARANPTAEAARLGIDLNQGLPAGTISTAPKQPLAPHQLLIGVAAAHSQDMIDRNFFDHVNPDGEAPGDRLDDAGYPWRSWGENIAIDLDPVTAQDALFLSPGHRVNMLRETYREVGVGVAFRQNYGVDMTELFASRSGNVFLTGVAFSDQSDGDDFFSAGEGLEGVTISATGRSRGTTYTTVTGSTGAYSLQVAADTYDLTASGGELQEPIYVSGAVVGTLNVKVDFVVPYNALPPDSFEPNDSLVQAFVLAAGVRTLPHLSIHEANDEDFFRWQAPADGHFIVELDSSRGAGNLDLFLYGAQGGLIASSRTLDPIERVWCDVAMGSEYYIRVAAYQGAIHPDYDLTIIAPGDVAPPVASDDRSVTEKDLPVIIDVLANDGGGVPLDATSVTIVRQPSAGQVFVDQATGRVQYAPGTGLIGLDEFTYQVRDVYGLWSSTASVVVTVVDLDDRPWRNPVEHQDVNADKTISAIDALILINDLNVNQTRLLPPPSPQGTFPLPYLDVTGDGQLCPQDVLEVVNTLNAFAAAGEGESPLGIHVASQPPVAAPVAMAAEITSSAVPSPALDNQKKRSEPASVSVRKPDVPQARETSRESPNTSSDRRDHCRPAPGGDSAVEPFDDELWHGLLVGRAGAADMANK